MRFKDTIGVTYILSRTELIVRKHVDKALAKFGLTSPQYSVLAVLEEGQRATNAELARICAVTPQTMSRIVQNLERDGFLIKNKEVKNGLKLYYGLTKKAEKTVCSAHVAVNSIEMKMVKGIGKSDLDKFQKIMNLCGDNLNEK